MRFVFRSRVAGPNVVSIHEEGGTAGRPCFLAGKFDLPACYDSQRNLHRKVGSHTKEENQPRKQLTLSQQPRPQPGTPCPVVLVAPQIASHTTHISYRDDVDAVRNAVHSTAYACTSTIRTASCSHIMVVGSGEPQSGSRF